MSDGAKHYKTPEESQAAAIQADIALIEHLRAKNAALKARVDALEDERAALSDTVNTCLREAGGLDHYQTTSLTADLRQGVEQILFKLNRTAIERDEARANDRSARNILAASERERDALRAAIEAKDAALRSWSQALEGRRGCHDCHLRPCSEHAGDYNKADDLSDAALALTSDTAARAFPPYIERDRNQQTWHPGGPDTTRARGES